MTQSELSDLVATKLDSVEHCASAEDRAKLFDEIVRDLSDLNLAVREPRIAEVAAKFDVPIGELRHAIRRTGAHSSNGAHAAPPTAEELLTSAAAAAPLHPALDIRDGRAVIGATITVANGDAGLAPRWLGAVAESKDGPTAQVHLVTEEEAGEEGLRFSGRPTAVAPAPELMTDVAKWARAGAPPVRLGCAWKTIHELLHGLIEFVEADDLVTCATWILATWLYVLFPAFPRLHITGPRGSGKSKLLEILARLCHAGRLLVGVRAASLFRLVEAERATILCDEAETLDREVVPDLQALLNVGYRRGATIPRVVDPAEDVPRHFDVFAPVAVASIRPLPPTVASRCIAVRLLPASDTARKNRSLDGWASPARWRETRALACQAALCSVTYPPGTWTCSLGIPKWMTGRARELWMPLAVVAFLVEEALADHTIRERVLRAARRHVDAEPLLDEEDAVLLRALVQLLRANHGSAPADNAHVVVGPTELATAMYPDAGSPPPRPLLTRVGQRLSALGFRRLPHHGAGRTRMVTAAALRDLARRYEVAVDAAGLPACDVGGTGA
jgi:hypothetical protein